MILGKRKVDRSPMAGFGGDGVEASSRGGIPNGARPLREKVNEALKDRGLVKREGERRDIS